MNRTIEQILRARYSDFTVSERMIASYLLENLATIPFETAASIGRRVGVSAMTVGRFLKTIGFARLSVLKLALRHENNQPPWTLPMAGAVGHDQRLQAETAAIADVYRLALSAGWREIIRLLVKAEHIYVAGFQTERGLAMGLAGQLDYVRPGVRLIDGGQGTFGEIVTEAGAGDVVVLIDIRRYSAHFRKLAEQAVARGVPVVVVTDPYCPWARDLTRHILCAEVSFGHFWDMNTALGSLLNLLVDDVVRAIGAPLVHQRLAALSGVYEDFVGFQSRGSAGAAPSPKRRKP